MSLPPTRNHVTSSSIPLSSEALSILQRVVCVDNRVKLPPEKLERDLYEEINDALTRLGGKWKGGKTAAHCFPYDPAPLVASVVTTGKIPDKNPTAYFPTPKSVVDMMLDEAGIYGNHDYPIRILEPSAGTGGIADVIRSRCSCVDLDVVEYLDINIGVLKSKGYSVIEGDFLHYITDKLYDVVLMNPPFSLQGDATAYITHIQHAWELLRDNGRLIAIAPPGFTYRSDRKSKDFRNFCCEYGEWWKLPDQAFKESGTLTQTVIIKLTKTPDSALRTRYNGWHCWHCWAAQLYLENDEPHYRKWFAIIKREQLDDTVRSELIGLYEGVVKTAPDCIYLNDECLTGLVEHLKGEWQSERDYQANRPG